MPDDDNTFTVIKGGIHGLDSWLSTNSNGNIDISYTLNEGSTGKIENFPNDLDASAVGSEVTGVTFDGFQDQAGPLRVVRRL